MALARQGRCAAAARLCQAGGVGNSPGCTSAAGSPARPPADAAPCGAFRLAYPTRLQVDPKGGCAAAPSPHRSPGCTACCIRGQSSAAPWHSRQSIHMGAQRGQGQRGRRMAQGEAQVQCRRRGLGGIVEEQGSYRCCCCAARCNVGIFGLQVAAAGAPHLRRSICRDSGVVYSRRSVVSSGSACSRGAAGGGMWVLLAARTVGSVQPAWVRPGAQAGCVACTAGREARGARPASQRPRARTSSSRDSIALTFSGVSLLQAAASMPCSRQPSTCVCGSEAGAPGRLAALEWQQAASRPVQARWVQHPRSPRRRLAWSLASASSGVTTTVIWLRYRGASWKARLFPPPAGRAGAALTAGVDAEGTQAAAAVGSSAHPSHLLAGSGPRPCRPALQRRPLPAVAGTHRGSSVSS